MCNFTLTVNPMKVPFSSTVLVNRNVNFGEMTLKTIGEVLGLSTGSSRDVSLS